MYKLNAYYFALVHATPLGVLLWPGPIGREIWIAAIALYWIRIWFVTAGYHCYFSHRSYKTSRWVQLVLAIGAQASGQGSALRWAAAHRYHHAHSDDDTDIHSPRHGLWHAHFGWLLKRDYLAKSQPRGRMLEYPELRWLDRHFNVPAWGLGLVCLLIWGVPGLCLVYGLSTIAVYHATFTVNSLAHVWGSRPYDTPDGSRNNWFVALIMLGGGWHNNHHRFPQSCRQGIKWWEWDPTYYSLKALSWLGLVWDLRVPQAGGRLAMNSGTNPSTVESPASAELTAAPGTVSLGAMTAPPR